MFCRRLRLGVKRKRLIDGRSHQVPMGDMDKPDCGAEGPTDDPDVEKLRNRQVKNYLTVTMMSLGVPMILMGDEVRRTQAGNNNAYCHDNELSWFDWTRAQKHADVHRFVSLLNERRLLRDAEHERLRVSLTRMLREAKHAWHGVKLHQPDWSDDSRSLAFGGELRRDGFSFHFMLNAYWEPLEFELPKPERGTWRRWIDTSLDSADEIVPWETAPPVSGPCYRVEPRSVVMLCLPSGRGDSVMLREGGR
jgi:glycogen operon protein